jgi:hypothetical protein
MAKPRTVKRWTGPIVKLPPNPRLVYLRKSKEGEDDQKASHDDQFAEITRKFGEIAECFPGTTVPCVYREAKSAKNFEDREVWQQLLAFCRAHPVPAHLNIGTIYLWNETRFSRSVTDDDKVDLRAPLRIQLELAELNWQLQYVSRTPTGDVAIDQIIDILALRAAAEELLKLRRDVRRGKKSWSLKGYFNGGRPPFPSARMEVRTGRILADGQQATEECVLVRDPKLYPHWEHGARMLLGGASVFDVMKYLDRHAPCFANRLPSERRRASGLEARWTPRAVKLVFTNPTLIGVTERKFADGPMTVETLWKSDPIVPADLFQQVCAEMARRRSGQRGRRTNSPFPLKSVRCFFCGGKYNGQVRPDGVRAYRHVHPELLPAPYAQPAREHGCRSWIILADELEGAVRDVIIAARCTPEAQAALALLLNDQDARKEELRLEVERASAAVRSLQARVKNVRNIAALVDDADEQRDMAKQLSDLRRQLKDVEHEEMLALQRYKAASDSFNDANDLPEDTKLIADKWATATLAEKETVFRWWVASVLVHVEHDAGKRFPKRKTALVALHPDPTAQVPFEIPLSTPVRNRAPLDDVMCLLATSRRRTTSKTHTLHTVAL